MWWSLPSCVMTVMATYWQPREVRNPRLESMVYLLQMNLGVHGG